jgi:hypothetical protein
MTRSRPRAPRIIAPVAVLLAACGTSSFNCPDREGGPAACADLPGVSGSIRFDDLSYSAGLGRIIAPLRAKGVALIEPDGLDAAILGGFGDAGSAAEGAGVVLVTDRERGEVVAVDPASGERIASAPTARWPDYVRYVEATDEIWVTEPGAGIEIFRLDQDAAALDRVASVATPGGPEGIAVSATRREVYVHGPAALLVVDVDSRSVTATWSYDCAGTHGIPALDEQRGLLLAGCADNGEVHLIDLDSGRDLGGHATGGGAPLMAFSSVTGHFYSRGDPGTAIAVLAGGDGLDLLGQVEGSESGHCLIADASGNVWTGDEAGGQVVRIRDPF